MAPIASGCAPAQEKAVGSSEHWNVMSSYATKHTGTRHVTLQQEVSGLACANCIATWCANRIQTPVMLMTIFNAQRLLLDVDPRGTF